MDLNGPSFVDWHGISSVGKWVGLFLQQERWRHQSNAEQGCCHLMNPLLAGSWTSSLAANRARADQLSSDDGAVRCEGPMSANSAMRTKMTRRSQLASSPE